MGDCNRLGGEQQQRIGWERGREGWMETGRGGGSRIIPWMCVKLPRQLDHTSKTSNEGGGTTYRVSDDHILYTHM